MVQNEGPERTGVTTFDDLATERRRTGARPRTASVDGGRPRPQLSDEDAAAVLQALDPFWTRGIVPK